MYQQWSNIILEGPTIAILLGTTIAYNIIFIIIITCLWVLHMEDLQSQYNISSGKPSYQMSGCLQFHYFIEGVPLKACHWRRAIDQLALCNLISKSSQLAVSMLLSLWERRKSMFEVNVLQVKYLYCGQYSWYVWKFWSDDLLDRRIKYKE